MRHLFLVLICFFVCSGSSKTDHSNIESFSEDVFKACKDFDLVRLNKLYLPMEYIEKCNDEKKLAAYKKKNTLIQGMKPKYLKELKKLGHQIVTEISKSGKHSKKLKKEEKDKASLGKMLEIPKTNLETLKKMKNGCRVNIFYSNTPPKIDCRWPDVKQKKFPSCPITGFSNHLPVPVEFADGNKGYMILHVAHANGKWYLSKKPPLFKKLI